MKIALKALAVAVLWVCGVAPAATQEAPARIPPPPPAPAIIHGYVYFDSGSDHPIVQHGDVVRAIMNRFSEDTWPNLFLVVGKTDTAGEAGYNMELSRRRALGVANRLVELGANAETVHVWACGETMLGRPTADGVAEPLNRMVNFEWLYGAVEPPTPPKACEVVVFPPR